MSNKKAKPESTPVSNDQAAAKVAVTFATGSRTKGEKKPNSKKTPKDSPEFGAPEAANVQDFVGCALLMLPANLSKVLGDKDLRSNALELETKELLVIVREAGVVAYVYLPILVKQLEEPATTLEDGAVLLDITGSPPNKGAMRRSNAVAKAATSKVLHRRSNAP